MHDVLLHPVTGGITRAALGLLLVISGSLKLPDIKGFSRTVMAYGILPRALAKFTGRIIPFVEIILGGMLLLGLQLLLASILTLLYLAGITCVLVVALVQKKRMENCGCFGTAFKVPLTWKKVLENLVWIALAVHQIFIAFNVTARGNFFGILLGLGLFYFFRGRRK